VAFAAAVAVATVAIEAILRVGLAALSLPLPDILGLSSYFIVQVSINRREAVIAGTVDLIVLRVFIS
jgi:hypothetical protein